MPAAERSFYEDEFAGATVVVSLAPPDAATTEAVGRAAASLANGGARLVAVVGSGSVETGGRGPLAVALGRALGTEPLVLHDPAGEPDRGWLADLWLAITDHSAVVVEVEPGTEAHVGAHLGASLRALKLVVTDPDGGWGLPPRSFADMATHADAMVAQLGDRRGGAVTDAIATALGGGVTNVNLCRPQDLDRELFTFDGAGTLFTSGGYVELGPLRVDDLPAVERLVGQGTADGVLRPRTRQEVARLAVTGLGARVVGSGHLAGIVSLETEAYAADAVGEVACLYTVSRFSGAGAGGLLVEGLVEQAAALGLQGVFAVTVADAAAALFVRKGFDEVGRDAVPAAKWQGYDARRLDRARVFWRAT
ncbi:MAG: GNAT family N-acetyltransferase [Actinobacteria bacterium]|nr:GNAT family N-acetyltransferase [Actinomycetota bacterium]